MTYCVKRYPLILCFLLGLSLVGCSSLFKKEAQELPAVVAENWQQSFLQIDQNRQTPEQLLQHFNDERLNALFTQALEGNYQLAQQAYVVEQARLAANISQSPLWPEFSILLNADRAGSDTINPANQFMLQGRISWQIDLWGRLSDINKAEKASYYSVLADYQALRLSLAGELTNAWYAYQNALQQTQLAEQNTKLTQQLQQITEKRYQRGLASLLAWQQSQALLSSAVAEQKKQALLLLDKQNALQLLLGQNAQSAVPYPSVPLPVNFAELPAGLPADIIRRRPDIISAEQKYSEARLLWQSSEKAYLPGLTLTAAGGNTHSQLSRLLSDGVFNWNVAGQLLAPVFNAGRLSKAAAQAEAKTNQRIYQYGEVVFKALLEINTLIKREALLRIQVAQQQQVVARFTSVAQLAQRDYQNGLITLDVWLTAQRDVFSVEQALLNIQLQRVNNHTQLLLALGGDYQQTPKTDKPQTATL